MRKPAKTYLPNGFRFLFLILHLVHTYIVLSQVLCKRASRYSRFCIKVCFQSNFKAEWKKGKMSAHVA